MTNTVVLIVNSGSSSVKFQVFDYTAELQLLAQGKITDLGTKPAFSVVDEIHHNQHTYKVLAPDFNHLQSIEEILNWINHQKNWTITAVAHRVVHGGMAFTQSVLVTADVLSQLKKLCPLAPLHQPHNLAAIEIIQGMYPQLPQFACFDTAFHAQHSPLYSVYALPEYLQKQGIRRYGFHGLSYEWVAKSVQENYPALAKGRIIAAHLGNGASLCAMQNGISIDTTMGLTALDGLPMGTRCGSLDPGAITYMLRELGLPPAKIEHILYNESGLLGLSGLTNNVRELLDSPNERAHFALDYFCLKTAQFIAMMAISLGGIDGLVFTGGIGENSEQIRTNILDKLQVFHPFSVLIIPANEEKMMAIHASALLHTK
ncbi:acetate/propionate family kinase [Legionella worsleiensis]|uniref:Acetate kinase n=1 Tax=Legionella worsleiensis TaxID=45076 RepID=A0A0W1AKY6_9GAMM|nr:acetate/propionate family kinase [Legionella worsleiensis]KTD81958.1 acetate kinase [Legionella worsleiensis]STY31328.1 acetate kinase [Legionella worsleiensis]